MVPLQDIKRAVASIFPNYLVKLSALGKPGKSPTLIMAKEIGVYLARADGHKNSEIAAAFGYKSARKISDVFSRASCNFIKSDEMREHVNAVADKLGIELS